MTDDTEQTPERPRKHTFLLSVWQEHPGGTWRASLQVAGRPERRGFATVEYLIAYLLQLTGPESPEVESSHSSPEGFA